MRWAVLATVLVCAGLAEAQEHPDWTVHRWLTEYYALDAAGADVTELEALLDGADAAKDHSPQLDQQLAGERGRVAKRRGDRLATAQHYTRALEGPDAEIARNAQGELAFLRTELLAEAQRARLRGDLQSAQALLELAGEVGADPEVVSTQLTEVAEALARGEGNSADTGDILTAPAALPPGPAFKGFYEAQAAGADIEDLEELLDGAEDAGAPPQRVAAERGYLARVDGNELAAGPHFLAALEGPDEGLAAAMRVEVRTLQDFWLTSADQYKNLGDLPRAEAALGVAVELGADPQRVAWERAWLGQLNGDQDEVTAQLLRASEGPNTEIGEKAEAELAARGPTQPAWYAPLQASVALRDAREYDEADRELDAAEAAGAPVQRVELFRGYVDKAAGRDFAARAHFRAARDGEDAELSKVGRAELKYTARPLWADVYGEGFGWARVWPDDPDFVDFAGTLRVRGYLHPIPRVALDPYIFFQISGDVRSRQDGGAASFGQPLLYADNTAIVGGGVLFRFWKHQVSLWAQVGAAFPWLKLETDPAVQLDVQAGVAFTFATAGCRPDSGQPPYVTALFCGEFYGDAVYRNRRDHNLYFTARGRASLHYLVTGPVAWAPVAEARFAKDVRNDYWNNLVDFGIGHRWRLMGPIGIDLMLGVHAGGYFGLFSVDPAPDPLGYVDFRLQLAGYASF